MKNILSRALLGCMAVVLFGCANYTLITLNLDIGSFVGDNALKATLKFTVPEVGVNQTLPDKPEGQLVSNIPKLDVLNSAKLEFLAQTSANITGSISIYVAPSSETTNVFQDQYLVSHPSAAGVSSLQVNFTLAPIGATPTPEQQRQANALNAIKSGSFRFGLKIQGNFDSAQQQLEIALKTFKISISGYPIKLVPPN